MGVPEPSPSDPSPGAAAVAIFVGIADAVAAERLAGEIPQAVLVETIQAPVAIVVVGVGAPVFQDRRGAAILGAGAPGFLALAQTVGAVRHLKIGGPGE